MKFKNSDIAKPAKNIPSQDGTEREQGKKRPDLFTKKIIGVKDGIR